MQPSSVTPGRTPFWQRLWFWVIAVVVLLAVVAGASAALTLRASPHAAVIRPAANAAPAAPKVASAAPKAAPAPAKSTPPTVIINNNPPAVQAPAPAPTVYVPVPAQPAYPADGLDPGNVVVNYYNDIDARDFADAWNLGGSSIAAQNGQTYDSWAAGYAGSYPQLTVTGESGGTVYVTVTGGGQTFTGYYTVDESSWTITSGYLTQAG